MALFSSISGFSKYICFFFIPFPKSKTIAKGSCSSEGFKFFNRITSVFLSRKSTEIYASFWKIRVLRMFFKDIRLAVMLATHPLSNSMRALAISGVSLIIDTPLALTFLIFDLTILYIMSIS